MTLLLCKAAAATCGMHAGCRGAGDQYVDHSQTLTGKQATGDCQACAQQLPGRPHLLAQLLAPDEAIARLVAKGIARVSQALVPIARFSKVNGSYIASC